MGFTGWTVYLLTSIFEEWENLLGLILLSVGVFYGFVGPSIIHTVQTIFEETEAHPDVAQELTAHISRQETNGLEANQLKGLALNTVVERMSTHIIAPLFWFGVFDLLGPYGIAGMLTYRCLFILNKTMEGKQALSEFDRPTAIIYRYANYLPSRICAFLMLLSSGLPAGGFRQVFKTHQHDA
jgi:Cobalamin biosynthesis protein CobD/CbiB